MIFAVVGPSGAGKDTLIAGALLVLPKMRRARRVITRPTSSGGEDFDGVTEAEFAMRLSRGDFALTWRAHGLCYGIPKAEVTGPEDVIFNGSRAGLTEAVALFPDMRVILVTAPDSILAIRLAARGRETTDEVAARLSRGDFVLPQGVLALTVFNDGTTETGVARLVDALLTSTGARPVAPPHHAAAGHLHSLPTDRTEPTP